MAAAAATISIERALNDFLAEQRVRLADSSFRQYLQVVDLLCSSLNNYAHDGLSEPERRLFTEAYDAGDEQAFCHLFGPEKIPEHLGAFLGYFMVRKVFASRELLRAAGTVTRRLVEWLEREGFIESEVAAAAVERAKVAARDLPRADRLGELLADLTDAALPAGLEQLADDCLVEDFLPIERVEPGALWFEGGIGPVAVPKAASELAEVGWEVNVVLARTPSGWRLLEVGCVYP
jgi:hypothetical protein